MNFNDDELISAYIDGRLNEPERKAFESRLKADAALRRRMQVTRLLVREARAVPSVAAPRNFILPRDVTRSRERTRLPAPSVIFRLGSVVAAALFFVLIGWDAFQSQTALRAPAPLPASVELTRAVTAVTAAPAAATLSIATLAITEMPVPAAPVPAAPVPAADSASPTASAQNRTSAMSALSESDGQVAPMQAPAAPAAPATPQPEPAATAPSALSQSESGLTVAPSPPAPVQPSASQTSPQLTPLRALAGIALLLAIMLGILGWIRRS
jgi:hypothetical protein